MTYQLLKQISGKIKPLNTTQMLLEIKEINKERVRYLVYALYSSADNDDAKTSANARTEWENNQ